MDDSIASTLIKLVQSTYKTSLYNLQGSSKPLLLSYLQKLSQAPTIVVSESFEKAEQLQEDLAFFMGSEGIYFFPGWDTLPYDNFSPHKDIVSQRFTTMKAMLENRVRCVITTPVGLMQRIMPKQLFKDVCLTLKISKTYDKAELLRKFEESGYASVDVVEERGEYSDHGKITDLFPLNAEVPVRLLWFENRLEYMKPFDVQTQLTSSTLLETLEVIPGREVVFTPKTLKQAQSGIYSYRSQVTHEIFQQMESLLKQAQVFPGIESLSALFYPEAETLVSYFPENSVIVVDEEIQVYERAKYIFDEVFREYELSRDQGNFVIPPEKIYLNPQEFKKHLEPKIKLACFAGHQRPETFDYALPLPFTENHRLRQEYAQQNPHETVVKMIDKIRSWKKDKVPVLFVAKNQTNADHFKQLLSDFTIDTELWGKGHESYNCPWVDWLETPSKELLGSTIPIFSGKISSGFRLIDEQGQTRFAFLTEEEIFGEKSKNRNLQKKAAQQFMEGLEDLKEGEFVVHLDHGIGRYEGLTKIATLNTNEDFMVLVYAQSGRVYVPVSKFHLVQKYVNTDGSKPTLNKLGDKGWKKTRDKVVKATEDIAEELIEIYAKRKARKGFQYSKDDHLMREFELSFPYEETPDQLTVIQEVKQDMETPTPMDRLVCGDVGYGKTEVAIRAAAKTVNDGRQVAVLVPTTILAQQHYVSFSSRFEGMPFNIDLISRFRTPAEQKKTLARLAEGKIDVLIGTHRLLSNDVYFKNLGLLVVDEEQRFGVKHKEKIKQYRSQVDILTLTATPIPRTLHMSLMGVRDLSVINTPPADRRAIRTRMLKANDYIIQEAVGREIRRHGQVFVVHNRVETIHQYTRYLEKIVPKARLAIAHGQMGEKQLEQIMYDFMNGKYDVLISTTIIESGLDIPRANTIIVNNADQFGLAQLYQLRGRVGRSNVQAYAYLLVPPDKILSNVAQERLKVLQELNDLGAGFKVASRDLELRGAGDLLGSSQSGHIASVGIELYTQMIERAVKKLKQHDLEAPRLEEIIVDLGLDTGISEAYVRSTSQRLSLYKKLASVSSEEELWALRNQTEDRYGTMPPMVVNLFKNAQIRLWGQKSYAKLIEYRNQKLRVTLVQPKYLNMEKLLRLLSLPKSPLKLVGKATLELEHIEQNMDSFFEGLKTIEGLFMPNEEASPSMGQL
ncbi:transcription-repair coupling factor [Deltaproteobacteria bacterium TL4]